MSTSTSGTRRRHFQGAGTVNRDREGGGGQVHGGARAPIRGRWKAKSPPTVEYSREDESGEIERARGVSENVRLRSAIR
jgi:hypothetical protein